MKKSEVKAAVKARVRAVLGTYFRGLGLALSRLANAVIAGDPDVGLVARVVAKVAEIRARLDLYN